MPDWRRAKFQPYKCSDLCEKKMFESNFFKQNYTQRVSLEINCLFFIWNCVVLSGSNAGARRFLPGDKPMEHLHELTLYFYK